MPVDVVLWQAIKLFGICYLDLLLIVGDIAVKRRLLLRQLIVQLLQLRARGVIFVYSGETKLQQLTLQVILRSRIGVGNIQAGESVIHVTI